MKSAGVIGAGFAGLSAALELARSGVAVTVYESSDRPGGRAQEHVSGDGRFRFDMGPTIITMRDTLARALGEPAFEALNLTRLEPGYRLFWPDGSSFEMHSDVALWLAEIERFRPGGSADALQYLSEAYGLLRASMPAILENPWTGDSWRRVFSARSGLKPWAVGSLLKRARKAFEHPKLVDMATFQTLYLGLTPRRAPAAYSLLMAQEVVEGVWYAPGGTAAIVKALVRSCEESGVRFAFGTPAERIVVERERARAIVTRNATDAYDGLVVASDRAPALRRLLGNTDERTPRYGHSAIVYYLGFDRPLDVPHHAVLLPEQTARLYEELDAGRVPSDPAVYLCHPAATDASATPGALTMLVPIPNRSRIDVDHDRIFAGAFARVRKAFGFDDRTIVYRHERGPSQFESELGLEHGAAFGPDHDLTQMGPMRPSIDCPGIPNVVFAGAGTRPGSGVPMVLISGRLAAQRLLERSS